MGHGLNYDCAPLSRAPLPSPWTLLLSFRLFAGIYRENAESGADGLSPCDSDYNALYEVDIVTDVMEPGTIFRVAPRF